MSSNRTSMTRGRTAVLVLLAIVQAAVAGCSASSEPPTDAPAGAKNVEVMRSTGLERPSSVLHDPVADVYLVANAGANGSAFITRLSPRGQVKDLRWIDSASNGVSLGSPGGMAIRGDTLYVADRDCIRLFHRTSAAPAGSVCPPGATALNDATVDARGRLYVSDAGTGVVHIIDGSAAITQMSRDAVLEQNGGLSAGRSGVFVAGAGVYQLRPEGPWTVLRDRGKRLNGIVFTSDGSFAFSNPSDSTVLFIQAVEKGRRGDIYTLASSISSPGDLGYDSRRQRILIPQTDQDRVLFVNLES